MQFDNKGQTPKLTPILVTQSQFSFSMASKSYRSNGLLQLIQITILEPMVTGLQEALPKSIGLLPFDGGVTGM